MTSLVVWVAVDQRGPASMYIATDSRISWTGMRGTPTWDGARKTYAGMRSANIIGYVGDVLYPALALPTVFAQLDEMQPAAAVDEAHCRVLELVQAAWSNAPSETRSSATELVHCVRVGDKMTSSFSAQILRLPKGESEWQIERLATPACSSKMEFLGSGRRSIDASHARWVKPSPIGDDTRRTSRAVFSAFCDSIVSGVDQASGGAPQLVGLYRTGAGRSFGVHWRGHAYLHGTKIIHAGSMDIEHRNVLFERVDSDGRLTQGAQRHSPIPI